jgi:predicted membrane-bound mannosyltransferase
VTLRRSLLWIVVVSVLPVLVLSAVLIGALDRRQRNETRDHVLRTLRALSEAHDLEIQVSLATLSGSPTRRRSPTSVCRCFMRSSPRWRPARGGWVRR